MKPVAILLLTQEFVPEYYRSSRHFINSVEFLNHHEWELSLDSLIEMAEESNHYFSDEFWNNLAVCADKMQMHKESAYCRQQIQRNKQEVGSNIPKGWTTIINDDQTREHKIAQIIFDKEVNERHRKDGLNKLRKTNGFHLITHGRNGYIYYIEDDKVLEIYYELSGVPQYDILPYFDSIKNWTIPKNLQLTSNELLNIKSKLLEWLKYKGIKSDLL